MDIRSLLTAIQAMQARGGGGFTPPTQRLSGSQGPSASGGTSDPGVVCFEDGTCVPGSGITIGSRREASRQPHSPQQSPFFLSNDGTGGPIVYGREERITPRPDPDQRATPGMGPSFQELLDLLRNRRR